MISFFLFFFYPGLVGSCRAGPAFRGSPAGVSERAGLEGEGGSREGPGLPGPTGATAWSGRGGVDARGKIEKSITKAVQEKKRGWGGVEVGGAKGGGRGGEEERAKQKEMKSFKKLRAAEHF